MTIRHRTAAVAAWTCALLSAAGCTARGTPAPAATIWPLEHSYETLRLWDDRARLLASLARDTTPDGIPGVVVRETLSTARATFADRLASLDTTRLSLTDRGALATMRRGWRDGLAGNPTGDGGSDSVDTLAGQIYERYGAAAGRIIVAGDTLNRLAILGRLGREPDREKRRHLFLALDPVWRSVNGSNDPASPWHRLLAARRAAWIGQESPIDQKAPAFGLTTGEMEQWLVRALEAWRATQPDTLLEPWDWYYAMGAASRQLTPRIPRLADLERVNRQFYTALGADPVALHIHYDLVPRPGKDPVAFTDFGSRPWHDAEGHLVPAEPWVFTAYLDGGFDNLSELLHETGHGIHIAAIRTRPAWADWPDNDTFTEALADVPALELYEPAWQARFLGDSAPLATSLRTRYSGIMMDMAWALFEIRVHRDSSADPNQVWSGITSRYLGIVPHPEWSWWAMRGQLIDAPGYLINYAFGAFITADIRARAGALGHPFAPPARGQYSWLSARLYRWGQERPSRTVLEEFLGRPLKPDALLADLGRMETTATKAGAR